MKKRMEDELWLKKIKNRLDDYSEPVPASGWERLEKDLIASGASTTPVRRILPFRRWAVSAAAVLLVAVSSVSLWLLQSPVADEVRRASVPALAISPDALPKQTPPAMQTSPAEPLYRAQRNSAPTNDATRASLVAQHIEIPVENNRKEESLPLMATDETVGGQTENRLAEPSTETTAVSHTEEPEARVTERYRPSKRDKLHLPSEKKSASHSKGWTVGLSVGNTGGFSLGDATDQDMVQQNSPGGTLNGGKIDLASTANGIVTIPDGQELVFKNGLPYLQNRKNTISSIDHKQPLSFGLSVRKNLAKGFSVESGITYTYLASDVKFEGSSASLNQKLHYIGIPVRANWNFVDTKNFTVYVSAGGAIEKCVYGKIGTENETVKPVQLSVLGAVGAQYNISNKVGLYVEPGVSYFFDDGSPVQTIRKENPCNFTLQAGIRLTY